MRHLILLLVAASLLGLTPRLVQSHPGRMDAKGCHKVWQEWKSQDGKQVYKAGTRHCHRVSEEVRLGQDEIRVEESPEKLQKGRDRARGKP